MGRTVAEEVKKTKDITVTGGISPSGMSLEFPIFSSPEQINVLCDVIIDFSSPTALEDLLKHSRLNGIPLVLCTTGYSTAECEKIKENSKYSAVFFSSNTSVGINVMTKVLKKIKNILKNFDIEIIEKHHRQKTDSPSGTALMLAKELDGGGDIVYGRKRFGLRGKGEIGMHSVRGGTISGEHEVIFAGAGETVSIRHIAENRSIFAVGALKAARFICGKKIGFFTMKDVLGL
jgi:4-hydroxy-tetrahydrodipicolinate reductase